MLAVSCNPAEERRRTYSFDGQHNNSNNHGSVHANSAPQLINFKPSVYPDLGTLSSSAPSDLVPNAPYFPDNNESGPTSPQTNKRSFSLENNYMTVETSAPNEPRPGYYKSQPSLNATIQEYELAVTECDTTYQELKIALSKLILQPTQTQEPASPTATPSSKFGFSLKTEEEQTKNMIRQKVAPLVHAEKQQRERIITVTATLQRLSKHLQATTEKLNSQKS